MIFVTVGTHEQQFNRLIQEVDSLKREGLLTDRVIMQTGFSTYKPRYCEWSRLFPYQEMIQHVKNAKIVITHGGPSSFIMPLQEGKIPVVVPRQKQYGEHVNDHQLEFCKAVAERQHNIIVVEDVAMLRQTLTGYDLLIQKMTGAIYSNNQLFSQNLEKLVNELFSK